MRMADLRARTPIGTQPQRCVHGAAAAVGAVRRWPDSGRRPCAQPTRLRSDTMTVSQPVISREAAADAARSAQKGSASARQCKALRQRLAAAAG